MPIRILRCRLSFAVLTLACSTAAFALPHATTPLASESNDAWLEWKRLDVDGNGALERFELRATSLAPRFGEFDFDQDGRMSLQEYRAWLATAPPVDATSRREDA